MAKITDPAPEEVPVNDTRADSTMDALGAIAAEETAETVAQETAEAAAEAQAAATQVADLTREWREALDMAREMIVATIPPLDPVWSADRLDRLAVALARCDERYGWGGTGALIGSPLFGLAVAGTPIAFGTYQVVKPMMDAEKAQREAAQRARTLPPGAMTQEQLAIVPAPAFGAQPEAAPA
jgi:hypothetical protein